jgi:hypothetical protein
MGFWSGLASSIRVETPSPAIDPMVDGEHGLPLMGTWDWNDGMNRVGRLEYGESASGSASSSTASSATSCPWCGTAATPPERPGTRPQRLLSGSLDAST